MLCHAHEQQYNSFKQLSAHMRESISAAGSLKSNQLKWAALLSNVDLCTEPAPVQHDLKALGATASLIHPWAAPRPQVPIPIPDRSSLPCLNKGKQRQLPPTGRTWLLSSTARIACVAHAFWMTCAGEVQRYAIGLSGGLRCSAGSSDRQKV